VGARSVCKTCVGVFPPSFYESFRRSRVLSRGTFSLCSGYILAPRPKSACKYLYLRGGLT
jgi:hypothetical protein